MQKSKTLLTTLLSTLLIFTPIYPHTAQASATYTLPANLGMEKMTNVAKRRGLTHPAIQLAIEGLVGAIDWIMLEGTVIKYHPKPVPPSEAYERNPKDYVYPVYYHNLKTTITHTDPVRACKVHIWNSYNDPKKYVIGYEFAENGLLSCKFADPRWEHTSSIGWMLAIPKPKECTLPLEAVLQEVINNAETGNQASIDYLQSIADEIAREEGKPTDKPKPTTGADGKPANPPKPKPDKNPEKAKERSEYSRICKTKPNPTGDRCNDARSELARMQQCLTLREAFSKKWYNDQDEGHMIEIQNTERAVKRLEDFIDENCKQ